MNASGQLIESACRTIVERLGHVVPKFYQERVDLGLRHAQAMLKAPSLEGTLANLERLPVEGPAWQSVIKAVTVGETNFFRHREWFAEIETIVLAPLIEERRKRGPKRIDLWSAGCSTGEEPYSLALIIDELLPNRRGWTIRIVGTDINETSLARAREGIYRPWVLREVDAATLSQKFMEIGPGSFQLLPHLRQMVDFKVLNLCEDVYPDPASGFSNFDLIICRNVLIYFTPSDQMAAASRLVRGVAPGGWLAVSPAEATAQWYRPLKVVNRPGAILFRNEAGAAASETKACHPPADKPKSAASVHHSKPKPAVPADRAAIRTAPQKVAEPQEPVPAPQGPLSLARVLADRGEYQQARQLCETHLTAMGPDVDAYLLLATVCLEIGDLPAGLEAARCAAYLDPDSAAAYYMLGTISYRRDARGAARRNMELVVKLLEAQPADSHVARYFNATAGELRASALGYLGEPVVA